MKTYKDWICRYYSKHEDGEPDGEIIQELIRCRDCRYFERDHFDAVYIPTETGEAEKMPLITAHEICTKWGDGCKTAEDGYCFLAERKTK